MIVHQQNAHHHGDMNRREQQQQQQQQRGEAMIVDSVRIATAHLPPRKRYEATFKCSFDLGSKKHRILDEQYTNGKNYVDISRFDLGDMLRRYADGAEHVKSREELMKEAKKEMEEKEERAKEMRKIAEQKKQNARRKQEHAERVAKEAQEKKRKNKEQSLNSTPVSTPVKKQKKVKENNNNNDNSSNDSGATVATHNNEKPKTPKKPRSLTASQKKSQSSLSIDTKASVDRGALLNTTTTNNKSGLTSDSDNENVEANKREEEEPEEEKPLTDEELARRMHSEMNASPRLGRTGGRNRAMSLLGSF